MNTTSHATHTIFGEVVDCSKYSNFEEDSSKKTSTPLPLKGQSRTETGARLKERNVSGNSKKHVSASNKLARNCHLSTIAESELSSPNDQTYAVPCSSSSSRPYQRPRNGPPLGKKSSCIRLIDAIKDEQFKNFPMIRVLGDWCEECYLDQPIINSASSSKSREMPRDTPARDFYIPPPCHHAGVNTHRGLAFPLPDYKCAQCILHCNPHGNIPREPATFLPLLGPTRVSGGHLCLGSCKEILLEILNPNNEPLSCTFKAVNVFINNKLCTFDDIELFLPKTFQVEAKMTKNVPLTFVGKKSGEIEALIEISSQLPSAVNRHVGSFLTRVRMTFEEPNVRVFAANSSGSICVDGIDLKNLPTANLPFFFCKVFNKGKALVPLIFFLNIESKGCRWEFVYPIQISSMLKGRICTHPRASQHCQLLTSTVAVCDLPGSSELLLMVEVFELENSDCDSGNCKLSGEIIVNLKSDAVRLQFGKINLSTPTKEQALGQEPELPNEISLPKNKKPKKKVQREIKDKDAGTTLPRKSARLLAKANNAGGRN